MSKPDETDYDVAIVGAGINGVGVAQMCAAAGYRCVVIEKSGIASATSQASSKLIHGGLRYLESAEFSLVHECLKARQWLLKYAPNYVKPRPFYIPIYKNSSRPPWKIRVGLSIYAALTGMTEYARFKKIKRKDWYLLQDLNIDGLKCVYQYWDAYTDDKVLTEAMLESAQSLGAELLCPAELTAVSQSQDFNDISYRIDGQIKSLRAKFLVNAAGPWVNVVQQRINGGQFSLPVSLVQGIHLVVKGSVLTDGNLYLEHPRDQRAVFVMPWKGNTLLGTTEKELSDPNDIGATDYERNYLKELWEHYFPNREMHVIEEMAGARVLPRSAKNVFKRSREARLLTGHLSLTIYGGKYTSFRTIAKEVTHEVTVQLGKRKPIADVDTLVIE